MVVCVSGPDVAVTVTVEVIGFEPPPPPPPPPPPLDPPPLPQPESRLSVAKATISSNEICKLRRLLQPKRQIATTSPDIGKIGREERQLVAAFAGVATVSVVEAALNGGGITLAGE